MASRTLRSKHQFSQVYSEGEREAGTKVVIFYLSREEGGIVPGFVASRKIGKACQRNRAKRIMREIFRRMEPRMRIRNMWIIFVAAFSPKENTFREIYKDVERTLQKAGLIGSNG